MLFIFYSILYFCYIHDNMRIFVFQLANSEDLDNDIDELLHEFESKFSRTILHTVLFY